MRVVHHRPHLCAWELKPVVDSLVVVEHGLHRETSSRGLSASGDKGCCEFRVFQQRLERLGDR